ncbi:hypothetical protein GCM10028810_37430 [Spirosoma litoris]
MANSLYAQRKLYQYGTGKCDSAGNKIALYVGLTHQHQNFFKQAFSFQGIEAGISINHKVLVGVYGATFASTLAVKRLNSPLFVFTDHYGFLVGFDQDKQKRFHIGGLLTIGYFNLVGDDADFKLFKLENPLVKINGFVLSPQVYGELRLTSWLKFRPGMGYSIYTFDEQPQVSMADLQNIAFMFGFILGKFN